MIRALLKRKLTGDLLFLYASFFAGFILPLATIPFLTRVLGKEAWSGLVFVQGFCLLLGVPLAWGFSYHGTRLIARHRDEHEKVAAICSEITAARLLLLVPVGALLVVGIAAIPTLRNDIRLPLLGFTAVALNSFSTGWILQGLDRMRISSMLDLAAKLTATLPVFVLISGPEDTWLVFVLQGAGALMSVLLGFRAVAKNIPLRPRFTRSPLAVYRESSGMFLYTLSGTIVNQTNSFLFGLFAPLQAVGVFAGAEKIIRAICALVGPFSTALHTKINYRLTQDKSAAARIFVRGTAMLLGLAVLTAGTVWLASDWVVAWILGPEFQDSAQVLRMLAILPVIHWLSYSISLNWFIAHRMDREVNLCVFIAALVTIAATLGLVPLLSVKGITLTVLLSETAFLMALTITLLARRQNPLTIAFAPNHKDRHENHVR